jgi:hypothetical protein
MGQACKFQVAAAAAPPPGAGTSFERVRIDIRNLVLAKAPLLARAPLAAAAAGGASAARGSPSPLPQQRSCRVVASSKHLCGVATDLSLRCLENTRRSPPPAPQPVEGGAEGAGEQSVEQAEAGLGRIVALHARSSASYRVR